MPKSIKAPAHIYTHVAWLSLLALSLQPSVSPAQTTGQTAAQTAGQNSPAIPTPGIRPPVARQIEPMVAPIRRVTPKQATAPVKSTPVAVATVPSQATAIAAPASTPAPTQVSSPQQVLQQTAPSAKSKRPPAGQALAQPPSKTPKIIVHTCKIGQDYSEKLKSCFTPGVTSRVTNAAKSARNKIGSSIENVTRSALGAKRKN